MYARAEIDQILIFYFLRFVLIYWIGKQMEIMENVSIHFYRQVTRTIQFEGHSVARYGRSDFIREWTNTPCLNGLKIIAETEFSIAVDFAPCKCMLVSDDEEALVGLEDHWRRRLNGALDVFRSEPYFLEVVPCSIDKSNTLGALLEKLGINSEEVIAIGDGVCDVSMIQSAGLGIAMGNAQDSVKVCTFHQCHGGFCYFYFCEGL